MKTKVVHSRAMQYVPMYMWAQENLSLQSSSINATLNWTLRLRKGLIYIFIVSCEFCMEVKIDLLLCWHFIYFMIHLFTLIAINNTYRYLDDIFNSDNSYFDQMVSDIYPHELQLNKTISWNFSTSFLDLHITINNNSIHTKI
jgi:hypothetical protein